MADERRFPEINRISIVLAFLSLALAMLYLIPINRDASTISLLGFIIDIRFDLFSALPVMIAFLALAGAFWIFSAHPGWETKTIKFWQLLPNLIIPVLTILIIGIALYRMERNTYWWIVLIFGIVTFGLVLAAEYQVITPDEQTSPLAVIGLTALTYGLYLILCITLATSEVRVYIQLPFLLVAGFFVNSRMIFLRNQKAWKMGSSLITAILPAEMAVGLSYLFINPIQYGLILTGLHYALGSLSNELDANRQRKNRFSEPVAMVVVTAVLVLFASVIF